jgi:hypothetical protein
MSLNRDESNVFQVYSKFNELEESVGIASLQKSRSMKLVNNRNYSKSTNSLNRNNDSTISRSSSHNESNSEVNNVDTNNQKIFFISSSGQ